MMPKTGACPAFTAIKTPHVGVPLINPRVPSIGSSTQVRPVVPALGPYSSPRMASSGRSSAKTARMAFSAPRSATVTGSNLAVSLVSACNPKARKWASVTGRAASAKVCAHAINLAERSDDISTKIPVAALCHNGDFILSALGQPRLACKGLCGVTKHTRQIEQAPTLVFRDRVIRPDQFQRFFVF